MKISGSGKETFLFLNGVGVPRKVTLDEHVSLLPASCSADSDLIVMLFEKRIDVGVAAIFLGGESSQLHITAETPKELTTCAWNSLWDAVLLSALFHCDAICNFQSDAPAESLSEKSSVEVTNYHLRGLSSEKPRMISPSEADWIERYFVNAQMLLSEPPFMNAVHCLASYRWHSLPRARLALVWAGIEGLFSIDSELVFRVSLYTARFLEPNDETNKQQLFRDVKRLYKQRSQAVHGSELKGDVHESVEKSAALLLRLIQQCVMSNALPNVEALAP
jgi:hypothetical protein